MPEWLRRLLAMLRGDNGNTAPQEPPQRPPISQPQPQAQPEEPSPQPIPEPPISEQPSIPTPERPPVQLPREGVNLGFGRLWQNHPNISHQEMLPCRRPDGVPNFGNQCAIRLGVCLAKSDLFDNYDGVQCWFGHQGEGHALRARELAAWMKNNASRFGRAEIHRNVTWSDFVDRTGILYCQNFWGENNQGDHVDLWDGTGEFMGSGSFSWEGPAMASGGLDYFERAEEVWFWPVH